MFCTAPSLVPRALVRKQHLCKGCTGSVLPIQCEPLAFIQAKILEHDNVNYLKKILGELAMVLDQIEAELEKRKLEYQGRQLCGVF